MPSRRAPLHSLAIAFHCVSILRFAVASRAALCRCVTSLNFSMPLRVSATLCQSSAMLCVAVALLFISLLCCAVALRRSHSSAVYAHAIACFTTPSRCFALLCAGTLCRCHAILYRALPPPCFFCSSRCHSALCRCYASHFVGMQCRRLQKQVRLRCVFRRFPDEAPF